MAKEKGREYSMVFKAKGLTDKQQARLAMEGRSAVNRIAPGRRTIIGIEKKGGK